MKPLTLTLLALSLVVPVSLRAGHPDISGVWHLDTAASTFASDPTPSAANLSISKDGKRIHIAESFTYPNGEKSREYEWRTDDRFHPVDGPSSGSVIARWDGDMLAGDRRGEKGTESIRMMLRDPSTLTQSIARNGQQITLIWRRR